MQLPDRAIILVPNNDERDLLYEFLVSNFNDEFMRALSSIQKKNFSGLGYTRCIRITKAVYYYYGFGERSFYEDDGYLEYANLEDESWNFISVFEFIQRVRGEFHDIDTTPFEQLM